MFSGVGYDSHWVPFFRYCNPCRIRYDVIGKLETAADDFRVRSFLNLNLILNLNLNECY